MAYQRSKYPPWSWSSSRNSAFKECRRKYYYNYYLAHNGWESDADEISKKAYRLKNLTGIHLLLGSAVHEVAEFTCKILGENGGMPEKKVLIDKVRLPLNTAWKESKAVLSSPASWRANPKQFCMLSEFYYGSGISDTVIGKIKQKMESSVSNLLTCRSVSELQEEGCRVKFVENMDTFELFDTPVYAIPDLVLQRPDGKWVVVDWKTGKEDESHPGQINIYCMYLRAKMGVDAGDMLGRVEYLLTGNAVDVPVSEETFAAAELDIKKSIEEMKNCLIDPEQNIPGPMNDYPLAANKKFCPWCCFYELCSKELEDNNCE